MIRQITKQLQLASPRKIRLHVFLIGLLIIVLPALIWANDVTVKGYGQTRDQAVRDALRAAVEQAVGVLVSSETITQNYILVKDEIYANSQGFVRDYEIIGEERRDGQVIVSVRATVDTAPNSALFTKLQQLKMVAMLEDPRIAVIIPEYHTRARISDPAGETAVVKKLIGAGFTRLIDPQRVQNIRYSDEIKGVINGDRQKIVEISSDLGVDYLIVGEGFSQFAGNLHGSGVISCRARIEARLIKADTGEIIAADGVDASGVDITEFIAAKKALGAAGEKMGDFIVGKIFERIGKPIGLQLIVKNIPGFNHVNLLEQKLRNIAGVKNVYIRDYNSGTAIIDLNYTGTAKTLAVDFEKITGNIGLTVEEVSQNIIRAHMNY